MVASSVAGISPYYRGRNGSLLPIGKKGRFLLVGKCRKIKHNVIRQNNKLSYEQKGENGEAMVNPSANTS